MSDDEPPPLPQAEYEAVYARVPRLTVEVVVAGPLGVLLARQTAGPCRGLWALPGGTVRYGEPLAAAVRRVARHELGLAVEVGELLGVLEYPSHLAQGIDWPVGIAYRADADPAAVTMPAGDDGPAWFAVLPEAMHEEQRAFLRQRGLAT